MHLVIRWHFKTCQKIKIKYKPPLKMHFLKVLDGITQSVILKAVKQSTKN